MQLQNYTKSEGEIQLYKLRAKSKLAIIIHKKN